MNLMIKEILQKTPLKSMMASPVITISETDDFSVVQEKLETHDIRHLPVVNGAGMLVGLITQRSLYKTHSPRKLEDGSWYYDKELLNEFILKNVMLTNPFTLKQNDSLAEAVKDMSQFKFGCVIVIDDYRMPCGIVTRNDILKFLLTK